MYSVKMISKLMSATGGIMPSLSNPAILQTFHHKSAQLSQQVAKNIRHRQCHMCSNKFSLLQPHSNQIATAGDRKFWSNDSKSNPPFLPSLMDTPTKPAWRPPIYRGVWMVFQVNTIRSKLDPEFSLQDFIQGARQALLTVSEKLSKGHTTSLKDSIEPSALEQIQENLAKYTPAQRSALKVSETDAMVCFPHKIRIITPHRTSETEVIQGNSPSPLTRVVQIMTVFHVWKGITEEQLKQKTFKEMYTDKKFHESYMVCNYRFFRKFENGNSTPWLIDVLTHLTLDPQQVGANQNDTERERKTKRKSGNNKKKK